MVAMTVDQAIPARALESIVAAIDAEWGRTVDLEA
jgi:D-3-phosphoglycerate dehydrogenase